MNKEKSDKEILIENLDMQIAAQCAPVIANIKISNLFITHVSNREKVYKIFNDSCIQRKCLYFSDEKITMFLYHPNALMEYIHRPEVCDLLKAFGYEILTEERILERFKERFTNYMDNKAEFPHEMGLLLGYPIEDVIGFIQNQGQKFMYSGYWKVYNNLFETIRTFKKYDKARAFLMKLLSQGVEIHNILGSTIEIVSDQEERKGEGYEYSDYRWA